MLIRELERLRSLQRHWMRCAERAPDALGYAAGKPQPGSTAEHTVNKARLRTARR